MSAAITYLVTRDARATIAVIVVAGACGVAAGTPLAVLGAIGRAARGGAIIKGGSHLEALWGIDTVVLDKTGTVTFGDVRVRTVYPARGTSASQVIEAAAIAETRSEHPVGRAIMKFASEHRLSVAEPSQFFSLPGLGVRALCNREEILVGTDQFVTRGRVLTRSVDAESATTVFVMWGVHSLGSIALADVPRPEAKQAVADMKALGLRTYLPHGRFTGGDRANRP